MLELPVENGIERRGWTNKKGLVFEQRQGPESGGKETIKAAQGAAFYMMLLERERERVCVCVCSKNRARTAGPHQLLPGFFTGPEEVF
jgi:hypothetical protein